MECVIPQTKEEMQKLLKRGYAVVSDSASFVTLERPKRFSIICFLLWCFFGFGVGGLVYIFYYVLMPKKKVTLVK